MSPSPHNNLNRFAQATWLCLMSCDYTGAEGQSHPQKDATTVEAAMVRNELTEERTEFQSEARLDLQRMDTKLQRLVSRNDHQSPTTDPEVHSRLVRERQALEHEIVAAAATSLAEWDRLERNLERRIRVLEQTIDAELGHASGAHSEAAPPRSAGSAGSAK